MVTSAISIADLFIDREEIDCLGRAGKLRRRFIAGRDSVLKDLANIEEYLGWFSVDELREQILFYKGLAIEASRVNDEYRLYSPLKQSDPNYEQLMTLYGGIRNLIGREIRYREMHSSSVE